MNLELISLIINKNKPQENVLRFVFVIFFYLMIKHKIFFVFFWNNIRTKSRSTISKNNSITIWYMTIYLNIRSIGY